MTQFQKKSNSKLLLWGIGTLVIIVVISILTIRLVSKTFLNNLNNHQKNNTEQWEK